MAVFNGRFVTLMDGKKFTDPIFRTAFNNTFPTIMEDIDRLEEKRVKFDKNFLRNQHLQ